MLCVIQEFGRSKKVLSGVIAAHELYPSSMLIVTFVGMLKGEASSKVEFCVISLLSCV